MSRILLSMKEAPCQMSTLENEQTDAWRQYLAKGFIEEAYRFHQTPEQRLYLAGIWADQLFERGYQEKAARYYVLSNRSFEEICLKFMKLGTKKGEESLERYLESCLEKYNKAAMKFVLVENHDQNNGNLYRERA